MTSIKELNDANIIDIGFKSILDFGKEELEPHFIYAGDYYLYAESRRRTWLEKIFLTKMEHNKLQFAIVTQLGMSRWNLITKETVKKAYQGKFKNDEDGSFYKESIHDDLETFFSNLQGQKKIKNEYVPSFFTPKLTAEELKLVDERNEEFLSTYSYHPWSNPDVDAEEMKKSDSSSKYVHGECLRLTKKLTLESNEKQAI